jgi:hypothetical protein
MNSHATNYAPIRWRVMLEAEDGTYCLEDRLESETQAVTRAAKLASKYGHGQYVYIEEY